MLIELLIFPDNVAKTFTYVTKFTVATPGSASVAKISVNLDEALVCQDGTCEVVSSVGVVANGLQICTQFIPGPNITSFNTLPI